MSVLDSIKKFFGSVPAGAVTFIDELGQFSEKLQAIFDKWDGIKAEWDALFDPQNVDDKGNWRVVTVKDAQNVLESIRINALKDRALQIYQDIKDIFNLAVHPIGGSAQSDQLILAGAAAYGGKPGAGAGQFRAASLINSVLNFEDRILELEDKILELVNLVDVIQDMRNQIEARALQQGNAQIRVDAVIRRRQGAFSNG